MAFKNHEKSVIAVDDQQDVVELAKIFLEKFEEELQVDTTTNPERVLEGVRNDSYDAVLSDFDMPEMNGVELLEEVRTVNEDMPFVLYTGKGSEEIAAEAVSHGVTDYFRKESGGDHYQMIANSLVEYIDGYRDMKERHLFEAIVDNSDNPVFVTDIDSEILYVNEALLDVTGYERSEIIGETPDSINSELNGYELFEQVYSALEQADISELAEKVDVTGSGGEYGHDQTVIPILTGSADTSFYAAISRIR